MLLIGFVGLLVITDKARADGGVVRASQVVGNYRVTVFTSPTPLRVGPADVSVYVQDAATGNHVPDASVALSVSSVEYPATAETATNKLFRMATVEFPESGRYSVTARVTGPQGGATVSCDVNVAEPLPRGVEMAPWIALPLLPIALFVLRERQLSRRRINR